MHHDEIKAQAAGMPSVFGHGMFSMGFLGTAVTDFVGLENLKSYSVRFVKQTWPGETFSTKVVVKAAPEAVAVMPIVEADLRAALRVQAFETAAGDPQTIVVEGYA